SVNPRTQLVPNAADAELFRPAVARSTASADVSELPRPVLGFAGNITSSKIDFPLLLAVAKAQPRWTFLIVGPSRRESVRELTRLLELPNVHWVGHKPHDQLPQYVAAFDVGLIPYRETAYTRNCFPLKLYEYLAAGKPVVASGLPELRDMEPDVVLVEGVRNFTAA